MSYELVIFDCDGTLVNSHDMNHAIMAEVANEYSNLSYCMREVEKEYLGIDFGKFFKIVGEKEGIEISADAPKRCLELALERSSTMMKEVDGCVEMLEMLAPHYKMNVASNANKGVVLQSLTAVGAIGFFNPELIVAGRVMAEPKPAPDLFLLAAEKMGVHPVNCLVIEDSVTGVTGAVAAGMDVWASTVVTQQPEKAEKELLAAGASHVFGSLIHIGEALGV